VYRPVHFGYIAPSTDIGLERLDPSTYARDLGRTIDAAGVAMDSLWVTDHIMSTDGFRLEGWTLLTWIAARHPEISIGTVVAAVGFRHAPLLAKMVASLDVLMASAAEGGSRPGRPILGLGAGWVESEFRGYGYDVPPLTDRIAQVDEALTIAKLLWDGGPVDFEGRFYRLDAALAIPARRPRPLLMVGGEGPTTMAVAARQADWWNMVHRPPGVIRKTLERMDSICADVGRDHASLRRTMFLPVILDTDASRIRERSDIRLPYDFPVFAGEPTALVDHIAGLVEQGIDAFQLNMFDWPQTRALELFAEHVRPAFPRDSGSFGHIPTS
jgi:alkanesulfonate monooxygenase SsuD/methylene tetrahydromethanopterin reductase-like flavin-dependent oxidoreductase (luciferase family)